MKTKRRTEHFEVLTPREDESVTELCLCTLNTHYELATPKILCRFH